MAVQIVTSPEVLKNPGPGKLIALVDTSHASWPVNGVVALPASPQIGARVCVKDSGGNANVRPITVDGQGTLIDGGLSVEIQDPFDYFLFAYDGTDWVVI